MRRVSTTSTRHKGSTQTPWGGDHAAATAGVGGQTRAFRSGGGAPCAVRIPHKPHAPRTSLLGGKGAPVPPAVPPSENNAHPLPTRPTARPGSLWERGAVFQASGGYESNNGAVESEIQMQEREVTCDFVPTCVLFLWGGTTICSRPRPPCRRPRPRHLSARGCAPAASAACPLVLAPVRPPGRPAGPQSRRCQSRRRFPALLLKYGEGVGG